MAEKVSYTEVVQVKLLADTYPLAIVVEKGLELNNVGMADDAHNLQFAVLELVSDVLSHAAVTCAV